MLPPVEIPPTLAAWEMSYRGLTFGGFGGASAYHLQGIPGGLDLPSFVSGDQQRALDQGEFAGIDLSPGRDITVVQAVRRDGVSFDHARQALAGVLAPGGATEDPLYLQLPSGLFACMARPRRHNFAIDNVAIQAAGAVATTQWHATDPRWYSMPAKAATVGLPAVPLGGVTFPLSFPASFGGGGTGGILPVENDGRYMVLPVFTFTGPLTNPVVSNLSLPGAPQIGFGLALAAGDTLVVNTDLQSAVYTAAGSTAGSSRRNTAFTTNTWFALAPGLSTLEFRTSDGAPVAGVMTVTWADAYLGI